MMQRHQHLRLVNIQNEMLELLDEASRLVRNNGGQEWERAKAYWVAQISMALSNNHNYVGGSMCTMEDTIENLAPVEEEDSDEEE
jgi:hypothetical protein